MPVKSTEYMKNDKRKKRRKGEGVKCGRRKRALTTGRLGRGSCFGRRSNSSGALVVTGET